MSLVGTRPTRPVQMVGRHAPPSAGELVARRVPKGFPLFSRVTEQLRLGDLGFVARLFSRKACGPDRGNSEYVFWG